LELRWKNYGQNINHRATNPLCATTGREMLDSLKAEITLCMGHTSLTHIFGKFLLLNLVWGIKESCSFYSGDPSCMSGLDSLEAILKMKRRFRNGFEVNTQDPSEKLRDYWCTSNFYLFHLILLFAMKYCCSYFSMLAK
jgi:hypothetical protein